MQNALLRRTAFDGTETGLAKGEWRPRRTGFDGTETR